VGCIANLTLNPGVVIIVGVVAGTVSVIGYNYLQPILEEMDDLHDTCGVHNLHGMPAIVGGLSSVFIAAYMQSDGRDIDADIYFHSKHQWMYQLIAIFVTIGVAIAGGLITGVILKLVEGDVDGKKPFQDSMYWNVESDYSFDNDNDTLPAAPHEETRLI
jgi:ammonium transporter Rh